MSSRLPQTFTWHWSPPYKLYASFGLLTDNLCFVAIFISREATVKMEVVLSSATDYGERYEEKELLGEGGFGKVIFRKHKA